METIGKHVVAAAARLPVARRQLDAGDQAVVADVDDIRQISEAVGRLLPVLAQYVRFL